MLPNRSKRSVKAEYRPINASPVLNRVLRRVQMLGAFENIPQKRLRFTRPRGLGVVDKCGEMGVRKDADIPRDCLLVDLA